MSRNISLHILIHSIYTLLYKLRVGKKVLENVVLLKSFLGCHNFFSVIYNLAVKSREKILEEKAFFPLHNTTKRYMKLEY
jgi:hypothetical protein